MVEEAMHSASESGWSVGDWYLEPRGLSMFGSGAREPVPAEIVDRIKSRPQVDKEHSGAEYSARLSSLEGSDTIVSRQEVAEFLDLTGPQSDSLWETVASDGRTQVKRHRDRSLCGGLFVRLIARIETIKDISHVAACYLDYSLRKTWDKQFVNFRTLYSKEGTDLLYYTMHVPPLADRDFVVFHTIMRHASGKGLLLYMRHADPNFVPPTSAVRGCCYVTAVEIMEHPKGGISVIATSAMEPKIPFLPKWIMNALVPSEWRKSVGELESICFKLAESGARPLCRVLFEPIENTPIATEPDQEPSPEHSPDSPEGEAAGFTPADDDCCRRRSSAEDTTVASEASPTGTQASGTSECSPVTGRPKAPAGKKRPEAVPWAVEDEESAAPQCSLFGCVWGAAPR